MSFKSRQAWVLTEKPQVSGVTWAGALMDTEGAKLEEGKLWTI